MKRNDPVKVTSYNPPLDGRVADRYIIPIRNIQDQRLIDKYPKGVPMVEVILDSGKLQVYVEEVVKKA